MLRTETHRTCSTPRGARQLPIMFAYRHMTTADISLPRAVPWRALYRLVGREGRAGLDRGSAPVVVGGARRAVVRAAVAPGVATDPTTWIGSPEEPEGPFRTAASGGNFSLRYRPSVSPASKAAYPVAAMPATARSRSRSADGPLRGDEAKSREHSRESSANPQPRQPGRCGRAEFRHHLSRGRSLFCRAGKQVQSARQGVEPAQSPPRTAPIQGRSSGAKARP